jgi:two-component system response regulator YesN
VNLLIVDDEPRTRTLLETKVDWHALGFRQIRTARNGRDALEQAALVKPDVVLCDVRMPKMNGIEFAAQYRKQDPACKIIFLSGYQDKEYLKSAIHLGALNYLEKPIQLDEVADAVDTAVRNRQDELLKQAENERLQSDLDNSLPFLRQALIRKLISPSSASDTLSALPTDRVFSLPAEGPYTVCAVTVCWNPSIPRSELANRQEQVLRLVNESALFRSKNALCGFHSFDTFVFVLPGSYANHYRGSRLEMEELQRELVAAFRSEAILSIGIGQPAARLEQLPASYQSARKASDQQFYTGGGTITFGVANAAPVVGLAQVKTGWETIKRLRESLQVGEIDRARAIVGEWCNEARSLRDPNLTRVRDRAHSLICAILDAAAEQDLTSRLSPRCASYERPDLDRLADLDKLSAFMLSFLEPFGQSQEAHAGKLREVLRYIHQHFHEKDFTIQAMAEDVNLTETYLCAFFKKQVGKTIKSYINELKLERSKELLGNLQMKLFEIALRLGFADANYFTTFFKKHTGMTPTEYRERLRT